MPTSVGKTFIVCCAWGFALSLSCLELCRFLSLMTIWRSAMPLLFTIFQLLLCFVSLGTLLTDFFVIRFWRVFPFHRFAVGRTYAIYHLESFAMFVVVGFRKRSDGILNSLSFCLAVIWSTLTGRAA